MKKIILLLLALTLLACTWVELSPEGKKVVVLDAPEVKNCDFLGTTTVSVKADVARIKRNEKKVKLELETLARNEAVKLQGDAVVPAGDIFGGTQVFRIYRCRK